MNTRNNFHSEPFNRLFTRANSRPHNFDTGLKISPRSSEGINILERNKVFPAEFNIDSTLTDSEVGQAIFTRLAEIQATLLNTCNGVRGGQDIAEKAKASHDGYLNINRLGAKIWHGDMAPIMLQDSPESTPHGCMLVEGSPYTRLTNGHDIFLSFLWIDPSRRNEGNARKLLTTAFGSIIEPTSKRPLVHHRSESELPIKIKYNTHSDNPGFAEWLQKTTGAIHDLKDSSYYLNSWTINYNKQLPNPFEQ